MRIPAEYAPDLVRLAALRVKRRRARPPDRTYFDDIVAWLHDRIDFREGEGPTGYQEEMLDETVRKGRGSGRGPHGMGKTAIAVWLMLWFADTRSRAHEDWKIVTTAGSWSQLRNFLWPEVHKWAPRVRGLGWRDGRDLLTMSIKQPTGSAFAVASSRPELIEGAHADQLLYIYDEAKSINARAFDASEGAFSGAGIGGRQAIAWAGSTPGDLVGRFADIHHHKPGYDDWYTRHVTLDDAMAAGRISAEWAAQRAKQWGETSALYQQRVLGEFAADDADAVIPLAWLEAANRRWDDLADFGLFTCVGVDVARYGDDDTTYALRAGDAITEVRATNKEDTMQTTGRVVGILRELGGYAVVDVIGMGAGVVDRLREEGFEARAFNASERSVLVDRSGELGFVNRRSSSWWAMRERLDPAFGSELAIPPDDLLTGDLTAPAWRATSTGKIAVESKDKIRKRIGRSTDRGDAVIQAFAPDEPVDVERTVIYDEPVVISEW